MAPRYPYRVRDLETLRASVKESKRVVPHSVRSLAEAAGSNRTTIGDLLTGDQENVSEALANRLAGILGMPFDDLFVPASSPSGGGASCDVEAS